MDLMQSWSIEPRDVLEEGKPGTIERLILSRREVWSYAPELTGTVLTKELH